MAPAFTLIELGAGDVLELGTATHAIVVFAHANPIDEPVVSSGPFVMNSAEEIRQVYADYRAGRFEVPA